MHASQLITALGARLNELAARIDTQGHPLVQQSRFDPLLFSARGNRLQDYLSESRATLSHLTSAVEQGRTERVAWLAQRLTDQMLALSRELATQNLRHEHPASTPAEDVYARLAEHQDYERRLLAMICDRDSLRTAANDLARTRQLQQEIAALEGRLMRCRQALTRLEYQIECRERGE
ncbi:Primosomal replication protein N'' [Sodalis glossinidius str. 'morsitans']|uniref:Primosomal replication protein N n=1 Tax=Sodalis glossinidius (strain morsitans) TaxID=343509 RepID=Q2NV63_SODGM|nr:primosomal replication protein [Sodalis glossinidius]BAE73962.1 primosomal replication protein N [Sodalis glossinidius str. 'morsitans']CRL44433.1 Primosomal replication protein N'' [Sodalis glossinidius str. 'morsitans']